MQNDEQSKLKQDATHMRGMAPFSKKGALLGLIAYVLLIVIITVIFLFG